MKITRKKTVPLACAALLFIAGLFGKATTSFPEPRPLMPEIDVSKRVLDNGTTVLLKEMHAHPIVTVMVTVRAGLSSEGGYAGSGISHFVEHMLFKGAGERGPGEIEREVKSYGGVINATTGLDSTNLFVTVPREYALRAIDLARDMVYHPLFDREELEKERGVILKEIRLNKDDPTKRSMRQLWATAFLEHPYRLPVIGYRSLFAQLTRDEIGAYHESHYRADNLIVTIVGDIDRDAVYDHVRSTFGTHPRKGAAPVAVPREPEQNAPRSLRGSMPINLGYIALGYHTVSLTSNDLYALDVLGIILGGWDDSRLRKRLVKEKELLYSVSAYNYTPKYPGLFIVYGVGDPGNLTAAREAIHGEIDRIRSGGVSEAELEAAKQMAIAGYVASLETTHGLAQALSQSEFLAGDPLFFRRYVERVGALDIESIRSVARDYLVPDNETVSLLYPDAAMQGVNDTPEDRRRDSPGQEEASKVTLANGIRLLLKEDHRLPKVSLVCVFLGGVRAEEPDQNGISNLTARMLLKGTATRPEDQSAAALERRGGHIDSFSGRNTFGITLECLSPDQASALEILEDVLEQPVFPEDELKKEKERLYARIHQEDDDVYDSGMRALQKALYGSHPYALRTIGEIDTLRGLSRADLAGFHQRFCVATNMVIAVVGDFDSPGMRQAIEQRFADMRTTPYEIPAPELPDLDGVEDVRFDMDRAQSLVLVGFRGASFAGGERHVLTLLSSVLSGENGRLYQAIRNELGLSYALGAFSVPGIEPGFIAAYVATDSERLKETARVLLRELQKVRRGTISEQEVSLARASLIGRHAMSLQSPGVLAQKMALDEIYGIGYDAFAGYEQELSGIMRKDVMRAAQEYIDLKRSVNITITGSGDKKRQEQ
jgi:zinc protease